MESTPEDGEDPGTACALEDEVGTALWWDWALLFLGLCSSWPSFICEDRLDLLSCGDNMRFGVISDLCWISMQRSLGNEN